VRRTKVGLSDEKLVRHTVAHECVGSSDVFSSKQHLVDSKTLDGYILLTIVHQIIGCSGCA
jgi:hypothetical protein